jgi:energy-coupling factor transporter transmembrane protein EcfT
MIEMSLIESLFFYYYKECIVIAVIIALILFVILRKIGKKEANLSKEERKKNRIQRLLYILGIVLSIAGLIFLKENYNVSTIVYVICIILLIASFILRKCKKKKASNIICAISIVLVFIIIIGFYTMVDNWNNKFLQYQQSDNKFIYIRQDYVSDIEGLINTTIKNNETSRVVTLIYNDTNYTSTEELEMLLNMLNTSKNYSVVNKYDKNDCIKSINISEYIDFYFKDLTNYEGKQVKGQKVKTLIALLISEINQDKDVLETKVTITYISDTNQTTIEVDFNDMEELKNFRSQIEIDKTYNVEIYGTPDLTNFVIRCNE